MTTAPVLDTHAESGGWTTTVGWDVLHSTPSIASLTKGRRITESRLVQRWKLL
jgi:hypothetical protein